MKSLVLAVALGSTLLASCALPRSIVAENYAGPQVKIWDSFVREDTSKAKFFVIDAINGMAIENGIRLSRAASQGRGFRLDTMYSVRSVPIQPMKVHLVGMHVAGAPIQELAGMATGSFLKVEGEVTFLPQADTEYVVTGRLEPGDSAVWIAKEGSGEVVTETIRATK